VSAVAVCRCQSGIDSPVCISVSSMPSSSDSCFIHRRRRLCLLSSCCQRFTHVAAILHRQHCLAVRQHTTISVTVSVTLKFKTRVFCPRIGAYHGRPSASPCTFGIQSLCNDRALITLIHPFSGPFSFSPQPSG